MDKKRVKKENKINDLGDIFVQTILQDKKNYRSFTLYNPDKRKILDIPYTTDGMTTRDFFIRIKAFFTKNIDLKYEIPFKFFLLSFLVLGILIYISIYIINETTYISNLIIVPENKLIEAKVDNKDKNNINIKVKKKITKKKYNKII